MKNMSPQHYKTKGQEIGIADCILENSARTIRRIQAVDKNLFPLLTLNHLSKETGIPYGYLRNAIARKFNTYRHFTMKKKIPGRKNVRLISIPNEKMMICQKWISQNILQFGAPHADSYAYHPQSSPVYAARTHTNSEWLIKVDIQDFFHAISEHRVYEVFKSLGYSRLLSFELARLCTEPCEGYNTRKKNDTKYGEKSIKYYETKYVGFLPQGAPTSPMLSNLVMRKIDASLAELAYETNMRFSRYADDIVFSCQEKREIKEIDRVKKQILSVLNQSGFRPNHRKTVVRGPGTRKIVLGMLVDGNQPRLTQEYKDMIRLHLHYLTDQRFGPASHAKARKTSISKMYHHVLGMIYWAISVEPTFGQGALEKFNSINWPPITKVEYFS